LAGALGIAAIQPVTLYLLWGQWRLSTYPSEHFSAGLKGVVEFKEHIGAQKIRSRIINNRSLLRRAAEYLRSRFS
jgi:hypothetical protein